MAAQGSQVARDIETLQLLQNIVTRRDLLSGPAPMFNAVSVAWVVCWLFVSAGFILFNKWVFTTGGFPYPWALTTMHMLSCSIILGSIRKFAPNSIRLAVMPDADVAIPWSAYVKQFLPMSVLFAATLGTGQMAYMYASVPFIQMMKPLNCVFASLAAFMIGMETPTSSHMIIVSTIAFGVIFASHTAAEQFSTAGAVCQLASSITEGCRLALVQMATTTGAKLDPVSTVYYYSFGSAAILACVSIAIEWPLDFSKLLSARVLVLNCLMAVALNIIVATVIKKTSAVFFTLVGVIKDIGVVAMAAVLFETPLKKMMVCGYSISLSGLLMYKIYKDNLKIFLEHGFLGGMRLALTTSALKAKHVEDGL